MNKESINDRIRKFIIKNTVGRITFSADDNSFRIILRPARAGDKDFFRKEISKYSEWKNELPANIDKFVEDTRQNATLCNEKRSVACPELSMDALERGYIVNLLARDEKHGTSTLRIMYIGDTGADGTPRFLVLASSRRAIHPEDILEIYDSTLWSIGYPAWFKVFRNGRRIPEDTDKIYQTFPLEHISLEVPSIVQEVIDAQKDFSYDEMAGGKADKLSFKHPSISLLMHEFSTLMPYYADFDDNGINGQIHSGSKDAGDKSGLVRMDAETQLVTIVGTMK